MTNFAVAMGTGLAWFTLVYLWFRPEPELRKHVVKIFLLGMVICFPVGFFNTFWMFSVVPWLFKVGTKGPGIAPTDTTAHVVVLFLLVAPIEELVKYFIVRSESYHLKAFDTVREGVMLATFSALGFATYENYHYMQSHGFEVIYLRGWLCPAAHMLFSAFFGYYLGLAKTRRYRHRPLIIEGLVLAALAHGFYNGSSSIHIYVSVGLVLAYLLYFLTAIRCEWHTPLMAWVAPAWMELRDSFVPGQRLQRPSLPTAATERAKAHLAALLKDLGDIDSAVVIAAIGRIGNARDEELFALLSKLTHDPDERVRLAATKALAPLHEARNALYKDVLQSRFNL